jgi:hypothetical protein
MLTSDSIKELSQHVRLVGLQEIRWEGGGTEPAEEYTFFYEKRNENEDVVTGMIVHKRIISAVKRAIF